jgi:hypothetical protein
MKPLLVLFDYWLALLLGYKAHISKGPLGIGGTPRWVCTVDIPNTGGAFCKEFHSRQETTTDHMNFITRWLKQRRRKHALKEVVEVTMRYHAARYAGYPPGFAEKAVNAALKCGTDNDAIDAIRRQFVGLKELCI